MTFSRRERILAVVTAGMLAVIALRFAYSFWFGTGWQLRQLRANLTEQVDRKQARLDKVKKAKEQLEDLQRRSLPGDPQVAQTTYSNWLLELAERSGFKNISLDGGAARSRPGRYTGLRFHLQGQATMKEMVQFLFDFYSAGYLHKLRSMSLQPRQRSERLDVAVSIEAMALAGAASATELSKPAPPQVQLASLDSYHRTIGEKDFFKPYSPPPPRQPSVFERRPEPPPFDPSKFTFLTAIAGPPDRLEAWLLCRPTGKLFQLRVGDSFEVGTVRGTIRRLEPRRAELEIGGQAYTMGLGENLREITPLGEPEDRRAENNRPPATLAETAAAFSEPQEAILPGPREAVDPR